jgi:hypothetical protein
MEWLVPYKLEDCRIELAPARQARGRVAAPPAAASLLSLLRQRVRKWARATARKVAGSPR